MEIDNPLEREGQGQCLLQGFGTVDPAFDAWLSELRDRSVEPTEPASGPLPATRQRTIASQPIGVRIEIAGNGQKDDENLLLFMEEFIGRSLAELHDVCVMRPQTLCAWASRKHRSAHRDHQVPCDRSRFAQSESDDRVDSGVGDHWVQHFARRRTRSLLPRYQWLPRILPRHCSCGVACDCDAAADPLAQPSSCSLNHVCNGSAKDVLDAAQRDRSGQRHDFGRAFDRATGLALREARAASILQLIERQNNDFHVLREQARADISRAMELEPLNSNVLATHPMWKTFFERDHESSHWLARQSIAANHANPFGWWALSNALLYLGHSQEAYEAAVKAHSLADQTWLKHWVCFQRSLTAAASGRLDEAVAYGAAAHSLAPQFRPPLRYLVALHANLAHTNGARALQISSPP